MAGTRIWRNSAGRQFAHHFDGTITPADVGWGSALMVGLSRDQWRDAFRAGGYDAAVSDRFINRLLAKIHDGLALSGAETR
jgi:hypothetical protein